MALQLPALEAKPLGHHLSFCLQVSDTLLKVLERSQHHPSLEQLWERQYKRLLAIPDHVWREEGAEHLA